MAGAEEADAVRSVGSSSTRPGQPMTQAQTDEIIAAIEAARAAGRVVIAVEFPRSLALARGPWSILGVDLIYHSWYSDGFNLKLAGTGSFLHDDEFHRFGAYAGFRQSMRKIVTHEGERKNELPALRDGILRLARQDESEA